jgi:hypothetical protein
MEKEEKHLIARAVIGTLSRLGYTTPPRDDPNDPTLGVLETETGRVIVFAEIVRKSELH